MIQGDDGVHRDQIGNQKAKASAMYRYGLINNADDEWRLDVDRMITMLVQNVDLHSYP